MREHVHRAYSRCVGHVGADRHPGGRPWPTVRAGRDVEADRPRARRLVGQVREVFGHLCRQRLVSSYENVPLLAIRRIGVVDGRLGLGPDPLHEALVLLLDVLHANILDAIQDIDLPVRLRELLRYLVQVTSAHWVGVGGQVDLRGLDGPGGDGRGAEVGLQDGIELRGEPVQVGHGRHEASGGMHVASRDLVDVVVVEGALLLEGVHPHVRLPIVVHRRDDVLKDLLERRRILAVLLSESRNAVLLAHRILSQVGGDGHHGDQRIVLEVGRRLLRGAHDQEDLGALVGEVQDVSGKSKFLAHSVQPVKAVPCDQGLRRGRVGDGVHDGRLPVPLGDVLERLVRERGMVSLAPLPPLPAVRASRVVIVVVQPLRAGPTAPAAAPAPAAPPLAGVVVVVEGGPAVHTSATLVGLVIFVVVIVIVVSRGRLDGAALRLVLLPSPREQLGPELGGLGRRLGAGLRVGIRAVISRRQFVLFQIGTVELVRLRVRLERADVGNRGALQRRVDGDRRPLAHGAVINGHDICLDQLAQRLEGGGRVARKEVVVHSGGPVVGVGSLLGVQSSSVRHGFVLAVGRNRVLVLTLVLVGVLCRRTVFLLDGGGRRGLEQPRCARAKDVVEHLGSVRIGPAVALPQSNLETFRPFGEIDEPLLDGALAVEPVHAQRLRVPQLPGAVQRDHVRRDAPVGVEKYHAVQLLETGPQAARRRVHQDERGGRPFGVERRDGLAAVERRRRRIDRHVAVLAESDADTRAQHRQNLGRVGKDGRPPTGALLRLQQHIERLQLLAGGDLALQVVFATHADRLEDVAADIAAGEPRVRAHVPELGDERPELHGPVAREPARLGVHEELKALGERHLVRLDLLLAQPEREPDLVGRHGDLPDDGAGPPQHHGLQLRHQRGELRARLSLAHRLWQVREGLEGGLEERDLRHELLDVVGQQRPGEGDPVARVELAERLMRLQRRALDAVPLVKHDCLP